MQETIAYLKLPYDKLAHEMSIPELVLRDAVEGKMGLTRGKWVKFGRLLGLPTTSQLRPDERDGIPCWEICFPPVSFEVERAEDHTLSTALAGYCSGRLSSMQLFPVCPICLPSLLSGFET
jgi:hypothetical protein